MTKCFELRCIMTSTTGCSGRYPEALLKELTPMQIRTMQNFNAEIVYNERQRDDFIRNQKYLQIQTTCMNFFDRLFNNEFTCLMQMLSNSCPSCFTNFTDFEGCAALTCCNCGQKFCGLCMSSCPDGVEEHENVLRCPLIKYFDVRDGIFINSIAWKRGRAHITNDKLTEYITTIPVDGRLSNGKYLKEQLHDTFHVDIPNNIMNSVTNGKYTYWYYPSQMSKEEAVREMEDMINSDALIHAEIIRI